MFPFDLRIFPVMRKLFFSRLSGVLLLLCCLSVSWSTPTKAEEAHAENVSAPVKINAPAELSSLQKRLDKIKQHVATAKGDNALNNLNDEVGVLAHDAQLLTTSLQPQRAEVQRQLDVLGPVPAPGALAETPEVVRQRNSLNTSKTLLDNQIGQATAIQDAANKLSTQIGGLRRNALKSQLALNYGSILSTTFWAPLSSPVPDDVERFSDYRQQVADAWHQAWLPGWRAGSAMLIILALLIGGAGPRLLDPLVSWATQRWLPEGHLRRSFLAFLIAAVWVCTLGFAAQLLAWLFTRLPEIDSSVAASANIFAGLSLFSALITGLGHGLLANKHPSWRMPALSDQVAQALASFPNMLSGFILVFGMVESINNLVGTSIETTLFGNGLSALLVSVCAIVAPMRVNRVRRKMLANGIQPEGRSTLVGFMHLATCGIAYAILLALLVGYIPLARFLTYELVWVGMVLACFYLLVHVLVDLCESLFSPANSSGRLIKHTLSLDERHLSLASTLFSALGKTLLLLLTAVALLNGTFGSTTPLELLSKVVDVWGGKGLEGLNIIPAHAVNGLLCLALGWYVLRSARRWLDVDFLPKTKMDRGMRTSLVTLFSNVGFVLVVLLSLSALGIEWDRLAWIVSALSVGIGFGLQEIVKNFISGLILLTERPVKVGDLVSISGVEGDVRRINVRATEIQLSDRSTVIVPNSQLISQNVRNATMGNAQGVVTIALTFPLDIDPVAVRSLLLSVFSSHPMILATPEPSVTFKDLSPGGIVLSVKGFVNSPRVVSDTKSDLLYEILQQLRTAQITLSRPQTMILEQAQEK
jgi:potassium efflux system protein